MKPSPLSALLGAIVLLGVSSAWAAGTIIGLALPLPSPAGGTEVSESGSFAPASGRASSIIGRNIFDVEMEEEAVPRPEVAAAATEGVPAGTRPSRIKVIGTLAGGPSPAAVINHLDENRIALNHLGDRFGDGEMLMAIRREGIVVSGAYGSRSITVGADPEEQESPSAPPPASVSPGGAIETHETPGGERRIIHRSRINSAVVATPAEIIGQAQIAPNIVNGEVRGFRVNRMDEGAILGIMGIREGDIIRSVNGYQITSYDEGVEVWNTIQGLTSFAVDIERGGRVETLVYDLEE